VITGKTPASAPTKQKKADPKKNISK